MNFIALSFLYKIMLETEIMLSFKNNFIKLSCRFHFYLLNVTFRLICKTLILNKYFVLLNKHILNKISLNIFNNFLFLVLITIFQNLYSCFFFF